MSQAIQQLKREKANRYCLVLGILMLVASAQYAAWAWDLFSWRAVGFAACVLVLLFSVPAAIFLFWIATSVDAVDPNVGESHV
jgi:hypothetical protein